MTNLSIAIADETTEKEESLTEKIERLESELQDWKESFYEEQKRADENYDRAENLQEKLDEIVDSNTYTDEYKDVYKLILEEEHTKLQGHAETIETIRGMSEDLKISYERLNMGVLSEIDEIIKITDQFIDLYEEL